MGAPTIAPPRRRQAGLAAVEFALILPLLMLLLLGVIDLSRGIEADLVLTNLSREGANLSERSSQPPQTVMDALAASAPPLDMNHRGMMYITQVMGVAGGAGTRSVVIAQYRWDDAAKNLGYTVSHYAPPSKIWSCTSWSSADGSCNNIPAPAAAPTSSMMNGTLTEGQVIYVVESFYQYHSVFSGTSLGSYTLPVIGPNLYSMTVF